MGLDRVFTTPTVTVDQSRYDELIRKEYMLEQLKSPKKESVNMLANEEKTENKKIMISQPMKGKTNEQIRNERAELVKLLQEEGYEVVDTVFENAPANEDVAIYMLSQSIRYIGKVDAVYFMKDWEKARGCRIEHTVAVEYGKKVFYEN